MVSIRKTHFLLDTNVLLRYIDHNHGLYALINSVINALFEELSVLYITPQNCIEFWNVATRPIERNGFGLSTTQAHSALDMIEKIFRLLPDSTSVYTEWRQLVTTFGVSGVQVHDARLVATMRVHHISHILTLNTKDFTRYHTAGITAIDPSKLEEL